MLNTLRPALTLFASITLITGILYPALVTVAAQALFPHQANGSLIVQDGKTIGSKLIGQEFTSPEYFWGRPSATTPAYNGGASSGSNLGPSNPALLEAVNKRIAILRAADPGNDAPVPVDLVTTSGSGLDPHISIAAAKYQVDRVARARSADPVKVDIMIEALAQRPMIPGFGEPCINVLEINRALGQGK